MFAKPLISLLALSGFLALPIGIATAGEIDIQNNGTRVRIDRDGDIRINSTPTDKIYIPHSWSISDYPIQPNWTRPWKIWRLPRNKDIRCNRNTYSHTTRSHSFGSGSSRTYSSSTTIVCQ